MTTFKQLFENNAKYDVKVRDRVASAVDGAISDKGLGTSEKFSANGDKYHVHRVRGEHKDIMTALDAKFERARPGLRAAHNVADGDHAWHHRNHMIVLDKHKTGTHATITDGQKKVTPVHDVQVFRRKDDYVMKYKNLQGTS